MSKRVFDVFVALAGIILFAPLFVWIALLIRFGSPGGPVLYCSRRIGRWGKPFCLLKFRTMVVNADKMGGPSTAGDDPRITRIGHILRKSKLDELPQLLNVLWGDMSFVGPRPEVPQYAALLSERERLILTARPGITDWATLWNSDEGAVLSGSLDPERDYLETIRPRKIALQLEYVNRHCMRTDLIILFRTLVAVVLRINQHQMSVPAKEVSAIGSDFE